jgi:hypothetical protein
LLLTPFALIAAFDGAWQSIVANGARLSGQQSELMRELLAKYIIEKARQGELASAVCVTAPCCTWLNQI